MGCKKEKNMTLKQSIKQYRNIKGVRFTFITANLAEIEEIRKECKLLKIQTRLIDGQLYKEEIKTIS